MYLIRVLSFIWDLRFSVRGEHVQGGWPGIGCRVVGAWRLPAGGIHASQGTFSSLKSMIHFIRRKVFEHAVFGLVFKHLPRDPSNVSTLKTMVDPYI